MKHLRIKNYNQYYLPNSIATEGIFDVIAGFFKSKGPKSENIGENVSWNKAYEFYQWLSKNTTNGELKDGVVIESKSFTLGSRNSKSFFQGKNQIKTAQEITKSYTRDLKIYGRILRQYKPLIDRAEKITGNFRKEADSVLSHVKTEDLEFPKVMRSLVNKYDGKLPSPISDQISESVNGEVLGNWTTEFTDQSGKHKTFCFQRQDSAPQPASFENFSKDDVNLLVGVLIATFKLQNEISDLHDDAFTGIDQTDTPWRGWDELSDDMELLEKIDPYSHPVYGDLYTGLYFVLNQRLESLTLNLSALLMACIRR